MQTDINGDPRFYRSIEPVRTGFRQGMWEICDAERGIIAYAEHESLADSIVLVLNMSEPSSAASTTSLAKRAL